LGEFRRIFLKWERYTLLLFFGFATTFAGVPIELDYSGKDFSRLQARISEIADRFQTRVGIEWPGEDSVLVRAVFSRAEFDETTGGAVPDWGIGAALPEAGEIVLLLDEGALSAKATELIAHELAHILLHRATDGARIPRWFDEGFAQWASGPIRLDQSTRLARAFAFGRTIPLHSLGEVNSWDQDRAELAYAQSRAAFDYLLTLTPEGRPSVFFEAIRTEGDFEAGFLRATGITLYEFYRLWAYEGARKFNYFLLLADWRLTFLALTIFFLIFGTIKLIRIKIAKQRLEDEETQARL